MAFVNSFVPEIQARIDAQIEGIHRDSVSAMKIASNTAPTTIGELQQYLQEMQEAWSAEDTKYLGRFKDQPIYLCTDKGVETAKCAYRAEFGLVTVSTELME